MQSIKTQKFASIVMGVLSITAQAGDFSEFYFFGDSLSDVGAFSALAPGANRFTNNPGMVWSDNLAASYGKGVASAYVLNAATGSFSLNSSGNNFAVGGAKVNSAGNYVEPIASNIPSVSTQVSALLARGKLNENALYSVWAGANDISSQMTALAGGAPLESARSAVIIAATDLVTQINRLKAAGGKNIVVIGVPNLANTPAIAAAGAAQMVLADMLSNSFNSKLSQALSGSGVLYFDGSKLFQSIIANPSAYGISNTTVPVCGVAPALGCTAPANGALFADGIHPTTLGQKIISDWVYGSLQAASQISTLAAVPLGRSGAQWRLADTQLRDFRSMATVGNKVFGGVDYAPGDIDANNTSPSAYGNVRSLSIGIQRSLGERVLAGALLGYEDAPFEIGQNFGKVGYKEWTLTGFAGYKYGPLYLNGMVSYGVLDYSTDRKIVLGSLVTTEHGLSRGEQSGVKLQVGYRLDHFGLSHGPFAGADWERVRVNGFTEQSDRVTAMTFGEQIRVAQRSRIGYDVSGVVSFAGFKTAPYAQISYEYQGRKDERSYMVGFVGGSSMLAVPTTNITGGYYMLSIGSSIRVSDELKLGVSLMNTFNQPGARNSALQFSLSSSF